MTVYETIIVECASILFVTFVGTMLFLVWRTRDD
jgi:nitrate reductase NapE component